MHRVEVWLIAALLAGSVGFRLAHLTGPLDQLMWRQTDTAYMARRMMDESPPEMLRPKAPYRGTHDVKAAEYPIYPAVVGSVYKVLGRESLPAARTVTLLFFLGSLVLLGLTVNEVAGRRTAWWSATLYALLPMGIPFSRMVHPDFAVVFMAHLFWFGFLCFFTRGGWGWYVLAIAGATGAFVMKAPYAFYFGVPVAIWVFSRASGWTWRNILACAFVFVIPLAGALWFNHIRIALEAPYEESIAYPMKWTADFSTSYFFGTLGERFDPELWKNVLHRFLFVVATPVGAVLAFAALVWPTRDDGRFRLFLAALAAGLGLYLLLMFRMVSSSHDYYSIPFMTVVALGGGWVLARLWDRGRSGRMVTVLLIAGLLVGTAYGLYRVGPTRYGGSYFTYDWQRLEAGRVIGENTATNDVVISIMNGRSTGGSDPRVLYLADRIGWSVQWNQLTPDDLDLLLDAGATVAAVYETPVMEGTETYALLGGDPGQIHSLKHPRTGEPLGRVLLFDLQLAETP